MRDMVIKGRYVDAGVSGERHPFAKLSWQKVRSIRKRFKEGETLAALAREFKVTPMAIKFIVVGKNWKEKNVP